MWKDLLLPIFRMLVFYKTSSVDPITSLQINQDQCVIPSSMTSYGS